MILWQSCQFAGLPHFSYFDILARLLSVIVVAISWQKTSLPVVLSEIVEEGVLAVFYMPEGGKLFQGKIRLSQTHYPISGNGNFRQP